MAGDKRARCETEDLEDLADAGPSNGSIEAKKLKTATGETDSLKRQRPPRDRTEEQLLNRLDQEEYEEVMKLLPNRFELAYREHYAREKFWDKFYSTDGPGTCPERRNQSLNSRVRKIVEERRKSCPWYFWGLEGYTRERFPEGWLCFYENGDVGDASQDNQLLYPWDNLHASNAGSPAAAKGADKTELWDLPLSEMEKSVKSIKLQIAESRAMLDEKKAKASKIRTEASATVNTREREAIASLHKIQTEADAQVRKIKRVASAKCNKIRTEADALHIKIQTEADAKFNESQADISELEETMKEKQSLLEVQEITLAARRANDSYVN